MRRVLYLFMVEICKKKKKLSWFPQLRDNWEREIRKLAAVFSKSGFTNTQSHKHDPKHNHKYHKRNHQHNHKHNHEHNHKHNPKHNHNQNTFAFDHMIIFQRHSTSDLLEELKGCKVHISI